MFSDIVSYCWSIAVSDILTDVCCVWLACVVCVARGVSPDCNICVCRSPVWFSVNFIDADIW